MFGKQDEYFICQSKFQFPNYLLVDDAKRAVAKIKQILIASAKLLRALIE